MTEVELKKISTKHPIILYDGFCFLCDRTIKYLIIQDREQILRYHTLDSNNKTPSTVKLLYKGVFYEQSDVMVMAARLIEESSFLLRMLKWIPKRIRDLGYRVIAANRYLILGRSETCLVPNANKKHLFLHLKDVSGK